jgi:uncharacterized protein (DUF488 family)
MGGKNAEKKNYTVPNPIATIGYEKATPGALIAALRAAGIETLVDVRAVARSRRPGFSKGALSAAAAEAGIRYVHLRGLGTPVEGREANKARRYDDFEMIFRAHMKSEEAKADLGRAAELAGQSRICLLCLEGDERHCHRLIVADMLAERLGVAVAHLSPVDLGGPG